MKSFSCYKSIEFALRNAGPKGPKRKKKQVILAFSEKMAEEPFFVRLCGVVLAFSPNLYSKNAL
jgi:hypothetical protein